MTRNDDIQRVGPGAGNGTAKVGPATGAKRPARRHARRDDGILRRDSARACALVSLCDDRGIAFGARTATGRMLERLSQDGMLPPAWKALTDEQVVGHLEALAALGYGPGKSADRASLVMLARGWPCSRSRAALLRALLPAGMPEDVPDAEALFSGKAEPASVVPAMQRHLRSYMGTTSSSVEDLAALAVTDGPATISGQSPAARTVSTIMGHIATESPNGREDYAGALVAATGTADDHARDHARTVIEGLTDASITDTCFYGELFNLFGGDKSHTRPQTSYDEDQSARDLLGRLDDFITEMVTCAVECRPEVLAAAAWVFRKFLPPSLARTSLARTEEEMDYVAALFAPAALALVKSDINQVLGKAIAAKWKDLEARRN